MREKEELEEGTSNNISVGKVDKCIAQGIPHQLAGCNVINLKPGSKQPLTSWKEYQTKKYAGELLDGCNYAMVCGTISNGVIVLDFDDPKLYEHFFSDVESFTVKTPSGGYHLYLKCRQTPRKEQKVRGLPLDLQCEGSYVCVPPSHINGVSYTVFKDLPILEIEDVFQFLKGRLPAREERKDSLVEEIKRKVDLGEYISRYVRREQTGKGYWMGKCPFHADQNPSFCVYEDSFFCFGKSCGEHGDLIDFVQKYHNTDFKGAIDHLCKVLGVEQRKKNNSTNTPDQPADVEEAIKNLISHNHIKTIQRPIFYHEEVGICYLVPVSLSTELQNMPFLSSTAGLGLSLVGKEIKEDFTPEHGINTIFTPVQFDNGQVCNYLLSCDTVCVADLYLRGLRGEEWRCEPQIEEIVLNLAKKVSRYVRFSNYNELLTTTFWIIGTYLHPLFAAYPYLIFAGEKSSGKSNALGVIANLAWNPTKKLSLPRETHLFRLTQTYSPTLAIEEYHRVIQNPNIGGDLIALLEVAWERGGRVPRCEGDNHTVTFHEVYTPIALATRQTVEAEDKGITIILEKTNDRNYADAKMKLVNDEPVLKEFRRDLFRLALTIQFEVKHEYDTIQSTESLTGRELILYAPLLAICKACLPEKYESYLAWVEQRCDEKRVDQEGQEIEILRTLLDHKDELEGGGSYPQISKWIGWESWQTVRGYIRNLKVTARSRNTTKGKRIYFDWQKVASLAQDRGIDIGGLPDLESDTTTIGREPELTPTFTTTDMTSFMKEVE
ncbi:MAG: bifunctional DNA primase/polymerase [Candidatus Syntropharchaeales archaeon]